MKMSMQVLQVDVETDPLFGLLNRALVESSQTACGLIMAKCVLNTTKLNRLQARIAQPELDLDLQISYEPNNETLAILLPDQILSKTHFVSLSVKQFLQDEQLNARNIVIASFPDCGIPKETDLQAMQAMIADEAGNGNTILIYNQPELDRRNSTILIIDEDETGGELLDTRLRMKGYEVYMANNGLDGLRLFNALSPDLVITELSLPVYDGYDVIRSIRGRKGKDAYCSIMVLSEMRMERDISACFELGVSDYIKKPYSPLELEARIRRLLQ
jgi:two-component system OmpR family response regulator